MASSILVQPHVFAGLKPSPAAAFLRAAPSFSVPFSLPALPRLRPRKPASLVVTMAKGRGAQEDGGSKPSKSAKESDRSASSASIVDEEGEVEEDLPWIQEKAMDLVEFTGTVTQAIPGPRVGQSKLPWILAVPLAYIGLSFVIAFVKTLKKFTSPRAQKRRLVNKNAMLLKSIDELFAQGDNGLQYSALKGLMQKVGLRRQEQRLNTILKTGFGMEDILRKYIRYALNEKPFNPELVVNLILLRKASLLDDPQVAEVLNEVSRRIVKEKGAVVMDISGFTEKGFKRKLAVQTLFGKILYLSELPEFCSRDGSLMIKEIFGVTDEDADTLRIHTLSESGDVDSLEKMVDDSDTEGSSEAPPS